MFDWLLVLLYCIVPVFTLSTIQSIYLLISVSLFFLVLMLYCSVRVLCVLKQPGPGDGDKDGESQNSMKRKAFKIILITLVFNSTTQFLRVFMLGPTLLCASQQAALQVTLVSLSICIVSGLNTPLLYLHRAGKLPCIKFWVWFNCFLVIHSPIRFLKSEVTKWSWSGKQHKTTRAESDSCQSMQTNHKTYPLQSLISSEHNDSEKPTKTPIRRSEIIYGELNLDLGCFLIEVGVFLSVSKISWIPFT